MACIRATGSIEKQSGGSMSSEITYENVFNALKQYYEVEEDDSVWEIINDSDDPIEDIVNAVKIPGD